MATSSCACLGRSELARQVVTTTPSYGLNSQQGVPGVGGSKKVQIFATSPHPDCPSCADVQLRNAHSNVVRILYLQMQVRHHLAIQFAKVPVRHLALG